MNPHTPTENSEEPGEELDLTHPGSRGLGPVSLSSILPRERLVGHTPPPRRAARTHRRRALVLGGLTGAVVLGMAALTTATVGAASIERAERAGDLAAIDLYERIDVESTLLRHSFVSERRSISGRRFVEATREDAKAAARRASAEALVRLLTEEARARHERALPSEEALRRDLESAVRALRKLEVELEVRERELRSVRRSIPGRLATLLGA